MFQGVKNKNRLISSKHIYNWLAISSIGILEQEDPILTLSNALLLTGYNCTRKWSRTIQNQGYHGFYVWIMFNPTSVYMGSWISIHGSWLLSVLDWTEIPFYWWRTKRQDLKEQSHAGMVKTESRDCSGCNTCLAAVLQTPILYKTILITCLYKLWTNSNKIENYCSNPFFYFFIYLC